ncbi:MAG TPA: hypothetical protein VF292_11965 [Rhodanobacteraceae bacterium]
MQPITASFIAAAFAVATVYAAPLEARTETLSAKVHQEQHMNLPARGMLMSQVRQEYGAPLRVLPTRGGSSKFQPPIHRWEYAKYIVYFEYNHVIHSVLRTPGPDSL